MSDLNFQLLPWQQTVYTDQTRFKVIAAGRRCGKSRLAATTLIIEGLRCPAGSAVLYVSPTMGQSRQIIWDLLLDLGKEVIQIALNDEHPGQMAALKMCMDRTLPVSMFEKDKSQRSAVTINITGLGQEPTVIEPNDITDV